MPSVTSCPNRTMVYLRQGLSSCFQLQDPHHEEKIDIEQEGESSEPVIIHSIKTGSSRKADRNTRHINTSYLNFNRRILNHGWNSGSLLERENLPGQRAVRLENFFRVWILGRYRSLLSSSISMFPSLGSHQLGLSSMVTQGRLLKAVGNQNLRTSSS